MSSVFLRDQQQINKKEIILVINRPCICKEDKPLIYFVSQPSISKSPSNINKPVVSNVQLNSNVCIKMCWIYMWHFSKTNKQKRLLLCFKKKNQDCWVLIENGYKNSTFSRVCSPSPFSTDYFPCIDSSCTVRVDKFDPAALVTLSRTTHYPK